MKPTKSNHIILTFAVLICLSALNLQITAAPLGTAFTYQGRLASGSSAANGLYDFQFTVYDALAAGNVMGGPVTNSTVAVSNGLFTVALDFGAGVFTGDARWLEIGVRTNGGTGDFTTLAPRQPVTPAPYAFYSSGAGTAGSASNLLGVLSAGHLSGAYSNALNLSNAGNSYSGDGSGLTSLSASALASGTVPDARLSANVALLNTGPTFTGSPLQVQNAAPVMKCVIASDTSRWIQMTYNGSLGPLLQGNGYQRLWIDAAGAGEVMLGYGGDNVGIALDQLSGGTQSPSARLDVNGSERVRATVRMGSETGTTEAPSPAGMVVRRINSIDSTAGQIVARTDNLTLERDGTVGGFLIRYPASSDYYTIACMGIDNAGNQRNFYRALGTPSTAGTVQIYTNSQNIVHFECTFGRTFNSSQHLTRVFLSRYDADYYWSGDVVSTYNQ